MAPVRRYLRITKYSVLEIRVYLENPGLVNTWLLRSNEPVLPRIVEAIRPLVLPKLREENERAKTKTKSKSKQAIKDVIEQDDFQVSIFLKDQSSRHYILSKKKEFSDKARLKSNSSKLTSWLDGDAANKPIDVDAEPESVLVEDDDDEVDMTTMPAAPTASGEKEEEEFDDAVTVESDNAAMDNASLFVDDDHEGGVAKDDKKKLGMKTMYDGFAIHGKILCLIVRRKGASHAAKASAAGQATMEKWVSTQVAQEMGLDQE